MTTITNAQICDAIRNKLVAAVGVAQSYNALTEGMNDPNLIQVYPEAARQDPGGQTDRTTFGAHVRQTDTTINVDYYARQRREIGEDMAALVAGIDAITAVLEAQSHEPAFGLAGIQQFSWSWTRVLFSYGDPDIRYIGARFVIHIRTY